MAALVAVGTAAAGSPRRTACQTRSLAAVSTTAAPATYDDYIQDSGGAPDFCASNFVTNDSDTLTIGLHIHNRSGFVSGDVYGILLDTDVNPATGTHGIDYAVTFDGTGAEVDRWNGTAFERTSAPVAVAWVSGLGPVVAVAQSDLGATTRFSFVVVSANGDDADVAPDEGAWTYSLTPFTLAVRGLAVGAARAGKTISARMTVERSDFGVALTEGAITCAGSVGGKAVAGKGAFAGGRVVCSWRLPTSARGKRFRGSVVVTYKGVTAKRAFVVRVK
jgi:hypothetical protein